jgi:hypothetical protein
MPLCSKLLFKFAISMVFWRFVIDHLIFFCGIIPYKDQNNFLFRNFHDPCFLHLGRGVQYRPTSQIADYRHMKNVQVLVFFYDELGFLYKIFNIFQVQRIIIVVCYDRIRVKVDIFPYELYVLSDINLVISEILSN